MFICSSVPPYVPQDVPYTDRKNVTDFFYLVLHLARKVMCYFQLFSLVLVTSINVLSKSKSRNYVAWIANLTRLLWGEVISNTVLDE